MTASRRLSGCLVLALLLSPALRAAAEEAPYAWVQHVDGGRMEVRAAVSGPACPPLAVDGVPFTMGVRTGDGAADAPGEFGVTVCAAVLPAGARRAAVAGHSLPVPARPPTRIAVLGDTGCRTPIEDCTSTWALPAVAEAIAARHPDLIIHLGDYLYRERGCLGDTCGYGWLPWRADFMDVAAARLFPVAPLLLVRGNHESCKRAAKGWFLLFDPMPAPARCEAVTPAWSVDIGTANLVIVDASSADDGVASNVAAYRRAFDAARLSTDKPNWMIAHKPLWAVDSVGRWLNATLQEAVGERVVPGRWGLVLSGHVHTTEVIQMKGRPPQFVLGNGGADLVPTPSGPPLVGTSAAGATVTAAYTRSGYGFALLEQERGQWQVSLIDAGNRVVARCDLAGRCVAAP